LDDFYEICQEAGIEEAEDAILQSELNDMVMQASSELPSVDEPSANGDQAESLEDVSFGTVPNYSPLKYQEVKLAFPADAGAMNLPLDDMLPRGFDLKDAQATNLAKKFDFDVASSSSDVESAPMHAGMILHYLSEDEMDLFEVHGASNVINFHYHTKHGEVSLQDSAQSEAFSLII